MSCFSKDHVPVITHDDYLSAASTRDNTGRWLQKDGPSINELTLTELKEFDVGGLDERSKYGQRYPEQKFFIENSDTNAFRVIGFLHVCQITKTYIYYLK